MNFQTVTADQLREHPQNPRSHFDAEQLEQLTDSVRTKGILNPLLVRPNGKKGYQILAGARRFRAAQAAGLAEIPVFVRELDDEAALELMIVDNLQRSDIHPLDEAKGYQMLMQRPGYDVARIAEKVGRSVKYIYDRVKLLNLTKEAQELFLEGKFMAGHAILLARLKPKDQERCLGVNEHDGGLFERERLLWDPEEDRSPAMALTRSRKAVSVRELAAWVDSNVRFDTDTVEPMLFPETYETLRSVEEAEKIIPITHEYHLLPINKDPNGARTYGPQSWKRADKKTCDSAVTGVIVIGPGRGEAFKVCTDKTCKVHWAAEQREKAKRQKVAAKNGSSGEERWKIEQRTRQEEEARLEAERKRWEKARPDILKAIAAALGKASAKPAGEMGRLILRRCQQNYHGSKIRHEDFLSKGKTAEDLVRFAAFVILIDELCEWRAPQDFPKRAKAFGIDVKKIVDHVAPKVETAPACRVCGCTEDNACVIAGRGCSWVEKDLCSNPKCVAKAKKKGGTK